MVGQIVYLVILLLVVSGLWYANKKGALIITNPADNIPVDYEVLAEYGTPLITLKSQHGTKYTFLVDTGANACYLDSRILGEFNEEERTAVSRGSFYGVEGTDREAVDYVLTFTHRNSKLTDKYTTADLSGVFNRYKDSIGREIHGVLGVPFLKKHGMNLDINRMVVWKKL